MSERLLYRMIRQACTARGVEIRAFSDGWLLELMKDGKRHRILGAEFGLNSQSAAAIAKDKVATSAVLAGAGVNHVSHVLLNSHGEPADYEKLGSMLREAPVVIKPLGGSHGQLVTLVESVEQARRSIDSSSATAWAASPFFDVVIESRVVVVDGTVRLAYQKTEPVVRDGLKLFNLHAGATAVPLDTFDIPDEMTGLALQAMSALGLRMAAVDIITTETGEHSVLEINGGFSLNRFAGTNATAYDMTARFYDRLVDDLFN